MITKMAGIISTFKLLNINLEAVLSRDIIICILLNKKNKIKIEKKATMKNNIAMTITPLLIVPL